MPHGWVKYMAGSLVLMYGAMRAAGDPALEPDTLPVPPASVVASKRKVELPAVPSFALPAGEPGTHDVRELRARGKPLLGTELVVNGYVTWIYDCARSLVRPGVSLAQAQQLVEENPAQCDRPKFHLGASPGASPAMSMWVVDLPRKRIPRERPTLTVSQLRARPDVPEISVGDHVAVTGVFARSSPLGEHATDGLVIYRSLKHLPAPTASAPPRPPPREPSLPSAAPMRVVVPVRLRDTSIEHYELCNLAIRNKQLDTAFTECQQATTAWKGNHLAWYALGNLHAMREQWDAAAGAYDEAVELRPDSAMYQMYAGLARYETRARATATAVRDRRDPAAELRQLRAGASTIDEVVFRVPRLAAKLCTVEPFAALALERARLALASAVKLAPGLATAHYYLGRIYREQDYPREAAEAFTAAIQHDPSLAEPYIALVELYRTWAFAEHSLQIARQGTVHVTGGIAADIWYELGMAEHANDHDAEAIAAFTRTLELKPAHSQAKFQRGQLYIRSGDLVSARRDLQEFVSAAGPFDLSKRIATSLLTELSRKAPPR
jgi:tetratricopeptide (TPR) repeat protein